MMLKTKVASLVSLVLFVVLAAGCNIYKSIDAPPDQTDTGGEDVTGGDATVDASDTTQDSTADTDEDGGDDCVPVGDPDEVTFYCDLANAECGDISVEDDCGTLHDVNCGSCGNNASCSGGPTTFPRTCSCDCEIGGVCYAEGNANPNNSCEVCDPATPNSWAAAPADTTCEDGDGLACTGVCSSGSCTSTARSGSCAIDGACYSDGDANPANPCEVCNPATSTDSWSSNEGGACDDGDGLSCTGICQAGVCESEPRDGACLIEGECWSDGEENLSNECQVCIVGESQTAWSVSNAFSCGGSNGCTCNQSFECVKGGGNPCN